MQLFFYSPRSIKPIHALGWGGVDSDTKKLLSYKLKNVDTTKWLWHHSDMKTPSDDIKKYIYQQRIIQTSGIRFGKNKIKGI